MDLFFGQKLGCASALVQAKLGHDLRPYFDDTIREALPERLQALVDEMLGYVDFRTLDDDAESEVVRRSVGGRQHVQSADIAFALPEAARRDWFVLT